MRRAMTVICSVAFAISGIMLALVANDLSPGDTGYKAMNAATVYRYPNTAFRPAVNDTNTIELPEDLLLDLAKQRKVLDTVYITKTDTIVEQVTKVKWKKAPAPEPVVVRDTIREAHYYLATQVGNKEGPKGECIPIYEVHKVDEVCPEITNSSDSINKSKRNVGE